MLKQVLKGICLLATAGGMLAGCNSSDNVKWGDSNKPSMPATKPAAMSTMSPSTPATPTQATAKPATATPAAPAQADARKIIRVKCGSDTAYTDKAGHVWAADTGNDGGDTVTRDDSLAITGPDGKPSTDPDMFHNERYGMDGYTFTVPNGKYKVNCYFAETYDGISAVGDRVFTFSVNGKEYPNFDIMKEAGGADKVKVVSTDVNVTDGKIQIKFTAITQNPCIDAIEIIPS